MNTRDSVLRRLDTRRRIERIMAKRRAPVAREQVDAERQTLPRYDHERPRTYVGWDGREYEHAD